MLTGDQVSHYRITGKLGEGGMGEVYLGFDEKLHRKVALKALRSPHRSSPAYKARFIREAQILSKLDHPCICRIYDFVETEEGDFLVLELVEGENLRRALANGLDSKLSLKISLQVAEVLAVTHAAGIVHRDLKPENIVLTPESSIKVLDFGVASLRAPLGGSSAAAAVENDPSVPALDPESAAQAETEVGPAQPLDPGDEATIDAVALAWTHHGQIIGTPSYMSPEQAAGKPATAAGDMYSLGLLMQEIFTGRRPYPKDLDPQEFFRRVLKGETELVIGVGSDLSQLISQLKAFAPTQRPTAVAALERLRWIQEKPRRRLRKLAVAASILVALLAGFKYTVDLSRERTAALEAQADAELRKSQAEDLIEYMLGDLRKKLAPVGRLDILDDVGDKAMDYFASLSETDLTDEELLRRSRALTQIGEVRLAQGSLPQASQAFEEALQLSLQLVNRNPQDEKRLFGLGTAHFWVGFAFWRQDNLNGAQEQFQAYRQVAEQLVKLDPSSSDWQLELGYAHSNLGSVLEAQGNLKAALEQFQLCLEVEERLSRQSPDDPDLKLDLAKSHNAVANVLEKQGNLSEAMRHFLKDLEIKRELVSRDPENAVWQDDLSRSLNLVGNLYVATGDNSRALELYQEAVQILERLAGRDPANLVWQRGLAINRSRVGTALRLQNRVHSAVQALAASVAKMETLVASNPGDARWQKDLARIRIFLGEALLEQGAVLEALRLTDSSLQILKSVGRSGKGDPLDRVLQSKAHFLASQVYQRRGDLEVEESRLQQAFQAIEPMQENTADHLLLDLKARILLSLKQINEARPVLQQLRSIGYRRTDFWEFCRRYGLPYGEGI